MQKVVGLTGGVREHVEGYLMMHGLPGRVESDSWRGGDHPYPTHEFPIPESSRFIRLTVRNHTTPDVGEIEGAVVDGWGVEWRECEGTDSERGFLADVLRSFNEVPNRPHPLTRERLSVIKALQKEGLKESEIAKSLHLQPGSVRKFLSRNEPQES